MGLTGVEPSGTPMNHVLQNPWNRFERSLSFCLLVGGSQYIYIYWGQHHHQTDGGADSQIVVWDISKLMLQLLQL